MLKIERMRIFDIR